MIGVAKKKTVKIPGVHIYDKTYAFKSYNDTRRVIPDTPAELSVFGWTLKRTNAPCAGSWFGSNGPFVMSVTQSEGRNGLTRHFAEMEMAGDHIRVTHKDIVGAIHLLLTHASQRWANVPGVEYDDGAFVVTLKDR